MEQRMTTSRSVASLATRGPGRSCAARNSRVRCQGCRTTSSPSALRLSTSAAGRLFRSWAASRASWTPGPVGHAHRRAMAPSPSTATATTSVTAARDASSVGSLSIVFLTLKFTFLDNI